MHSRLECSYGSQIKQSRRRNYLIHLEQKVQRLEHELRSARSTSLSDAIPRQPSNTSTEQSIAHGPRAGVQDYNGTALDVTANTMCFWNNTYKPFEQQSGPNEWAGNAPAKPFLSELMIPTQCLQSSDYIYRADSLSVSRIYTESCLTVSLTIDSRKLHRLLHRPHGRLFLET